jgi:hypothetical protein
VLLGLGSWVIISSSKRKKKKRKPKVVHTCSHFQAISNTHCSPENERLDYSRLANNIALYIHEGSSHSFPYVVASVRISREMETCFAKNAIFVWVLAIALSPLASVKAGCSKEQTRALLEIKNATNASSLAGWDGRDCCEAGAIFCYGIAGGVSEMYLGYASSRSTWYPNVSLFTLFDELEVLSLGNMQIGGGLERT